MKRRFGDRNDELARLLGGKPGAVYGYWLLIDGTLLPVEFGDEGHRTVARSYLQKHNPDLLQAHGEYGGMFYLGAIRIADHNGFLSANLLVAPTDPQISQLRSLAKVGGAGGVIDILESSAKSFPKAAVDFTPTANWGRIRAEIEDAIKSEVHNRRRSVAEWASQPELRWRQRKYAQGKHGFTDEQSDILAAEFDARRRLEEREAGPQMTSDQAYDWGDDGSIEREIFKEDTRAWEQAMEAGLPCPVCATQEPTDNPGGICDRCLVHAAELIHEAIDD